MNTLSRIIKAYNEQITCEDAIEVSTWRRALQQWYASPPHTI